MLEIDGSEGGGQILRTALALSVVTGEAVTIEGIRGNRPEPGLKPQHLAAVETLATVSSATVEGASAGSESLTFEPGAPTGGEMSVDIGTAGSIPLLFDAVLPVATVLSEPLQVTATGGTEVKWSPPLAAHEHAKLPLCRELGLQAATDRKQTGFYPAGGGKAMLYLTPSAPEPLSLTDRGPLRGAHIYSRESEDLAANNVAQRQAVAARRRLQDGAVEVLETVQTTVTTNSAGSALSIVLDYDRTRAGADALGERDKSAEEVADEAVADALSFEAGSAAVDDHLADQLLVLLALAGGQLRIGERTPHVQSSLDLLASFGFEMRVVENESSVTITAPSPSRQ